MKIFTVVGIRRSGKTTTITNLIGEFKSRGLRVATIKTIFCPAFSMDDPKSNTARHKAAGAEVVVARGNGETDISYPKTMSQTEILDRLPNVDLLILEGDYEAAVPRIVCAHKEEDARERLNARTICISGRLADRTEEFCDYPAISSMTDLARLADFIIDHVPEAGDVIDIEPSNLAYTGICQCGCHKGNDALIPHYHPSGRKHLFLTGPKQVGKSTLLEKVIRDLQIEPAGFQTRAYDIGGQRAGFYMHSLEEVTGYKNDVPVTARLGGMHGMIGISDSFERFGAALLQQALKTGKPLLMDELGKAEKEAGHFKQTVFEALDSCPMALGVLQAVDTDFIKAISDREDVRMVEVDEANRDILLGELSAFVESQLRIYNDYKGPVQQTEHQDCIYDET